MKTTFNKHVKWRLDNADIFICDCKRLIDLKLSLNFEKSVKKIGSGFYEDELDSNEKKLFSDLNKMRLLSNFEVRNIQLEEFDKALNILDNELGTKRVRDNNFLEEKFIEYPQFFIGAFIDNEIVGVICGFPREDYLLISELAIDSRFQKRSFGKQLVKEFENKAKGYSKINVGAEDNTIGFYQSLNYKPFLLIQFEKESESLQVLKKFNIIKKGKGFLEAEVDCPSLKEIKKFKEEFPNLHFQYIFTKRLLTN